MAVTRPSPSRRRFLDAVAQAHEHWVDEKLKADTSIFRPRRSGSDYNLHYIDIEADAADLDDAVPRRLG